MSTGFDTVNTNFTINVFMMKFLKECVKPYWLLQSDKGYIHSPLYTLLWQFCKFYRFSKCETFLSLYIRNILIYDKSAIVPNF